MRRSKKHMDNPEEKKNYLCPDCGYEFDEPQRRYMKSPGSGYFGIRKEGELKNGNTNKAI